MQPHPPGYSVPAFPAFPSTTRYVPLGSVHDAMGRVCRSIDAKEAVSLVIGPPGTGKSLVCGLLARHYEKTHHVVVLGETPIEGKVAFLRRLLRQLGVDLRQVSDGDLHMELVERVSAAEFPSGGLLVIVDEAQSLSAEVLESIRTVTNIMRAGEPRVMAVLCGGVSLDETLVDRSLEAFTQRVATRCYLHPLNGDETRRYITQTIRDLGGDPDGTVTDTAMAAVHHACSGVPRLINQMMTQAIDCAEEADQSLITDQIVDIAWAELQQLPSPMVEEPKLGDQKSPVEFGELSEPVERADSNPLDATAAARSEAKAATVMWLDEPAPESRQVELLRAEPRQVEPRPAKAPSLPMVDAEALFGQFECEEEVVVGNPFGTAAVPMRSAAVESEPRLDAMLHQELVGWSTMDATSILGSDPGVGGDPGVGDPGVDELGVADTGLETVADAEPEKEADTFAEPIVHSVEGATPCLALAEDEDEASDNSVLWIGDVEEADANRDDSDLLVVEDEIESSRRRVPMRIDSKEESIIVDFHAMLARMRTGG